eukprot:scaffold61022_cov39-Cyclotella_meneghiniana.AAC.2
MEMKSDLTERRREKSLCKTEELEENVRRGRRLAESKSRNQYPAVFDALTPTHQDILETRLNARKERREPSEPRLAFLASGLLTRKIDPCLYYKKGMIVLTYVDDSIIVGNNMRNIDNFVRSMQNGKENFILTDE